ncbi:MAG TPA: hypothetical protein VFG05_06475 [Methylocella sp.]|nr:hypothetical protein [Methylocella sp.]
MAALPFHGERWPFTSIYDEAWNMSEMENVSDFEPRLKNFYFIHLPGDFYPLGRKFRTLAHLIADKIPKNADRDDALEKLSAAMDNALRALESARCAQL